MPAVFLSVSLSLLLFFAGILLCAYTHFLPLGLHMLWGFFTALLLVLLQCLVFGFFIGSGKSIKRVVAENGLSGDWIQKTKDYKNRCYPPVMLALVLTVAAAAVGGGVSVGSVPVWLHQALVWAALAVNAYSFRVSYRVLVENVEAIHKINEEIRLNRAQAKDSVTSPILSGSRRNPIPRVRWGTSRNFYFLAAAVWVPYLYMKFSLGSRTVPLWPFLVLSILCLLAGMWMGPGKGKP